MEFPSPKAFAAHLAKLAAIGPAVTHHITEQAAGEIAATARGMIGFYQDAVGPYPKWEQLADSTEQEKARLGYEQDAPLLRDGTMERSIGHKAVESEAVVGSNDPKMEWHELGTPRMPPRPVLGPAAIHSRGRVKGIVGWTALAWLSGRGWKRPRRIEQAGERAE